jgi:hypothetical protein
MYCIVRITWEYQGRTGYAFDIFGFPELGKDYDMLEWDDYWYTEGNGSCDRNRWYIIDLPESLDSCGDTIKFLKVEMVTPLVEHERDLRFSRTTKNILWNLDRDPPYAGH